MDASGPAIILDEIRHWSKVPRQASVLRFQNHLYGCFAILEILGEDVSRNVFDTSFSFHTVGPMFGFSDDTRTEFSAWSTKYQNAWKHVWATLGSPSKLDDIDALERTVFNTVSDASDSFEFFIYAVDNGGLSDELTDKAAKLLDEKQVKYKLKGTRRMKGKRTITPIRKFFKKTRKAYRPSLSYTASQSI